MRDMVCYSINTGGGAVRLGMQIIPSQLSSPTKAFRQLQIEWTKFALRSGVHKHKFIFVLAHPRSGSTLLSHILTSHPEFSFGGELFIKYEHPTDLAKLLVETCRRLRKVRLRTKNVVDKIVYDGLITDEVLAAPSIYRCILLIRSPEASLKSMVHYFGWDETTALRCYVDRLHALIRHGSVLRERAFLLEYDDLIERSEEMLEALGRFFGRAYSFKSSYKTSRITTQTLGDSSPNIWACRIIRTRTHDVTIGAEALAKASGAFQSCRHQLSQAGVVLPMTKSAQGMFLTNDA